MFGMIQGRRWDRHICLQSTTVFPSLYFWLPRITTRNKGNDDFTCFIKDFPKQTKMCVCASVEVFGNQVTQRTLGNKGADCVIKLFYQHVYFG